MTFSRAALHHFAASHDRSSLAALRRHAVANGRRCRLAQSCNGRRGEAAKRGFYFRHEPERLCRNLNQTPGGRTAFLGNPSRLGLGP
jgi:hypothetical protein